MANPAPIRCRSEAYDFFASQLPGLHTTRGLLLAATAVAMHELEDVDPHDVEVGVDVLAYEILGRVHSDHPSALLAHAHDILFDKYGFIGNTQEYDHPDNSYMPLVIERRTGLPITLCLLYKAVLERVGLTVHGVGAPGHFLAGVEQEDQTVMLVDPFFAGRALTVDEAVRRIEQMAGVPIADPREVLPHASHPLWLMRLLENLKISFQRRGRAADMSAMIEMQVLLARQG